MFSLPFQVHVDALVYYLQIDQLMHKNDKSLFCQLKLCIGHFTSHFKGINYKKLIHSLFQCTHLVLQIGN